MCSTASRTAGDLFAGALTTEQSLPGEELSVDSMELTLRTGDEPAVVDITSEVAVFCCATRATAWCRCSSPTPPPGVAIIETGAGSDGDLLAALAELLPGTAAGPTVTARPATAPTTSCRRWCRRA